MAPSTTTVVTNAEMTVVTTGMLATIGTRGMTGTPVTIVMLVMTATRVMTDATTATPGMTAAGRNAPPTEPNARALHPVAPSMMIVAQPGRHPPSGSMMKGDLQGTMTDEERMIIAENLTLILTAVGTTAGVKRGTNGTNGPRGRMGITDGLAEVGRNAYGFLPFGVPSDHDRLFPSPRNLLQNRCFPFLDVLLAMICTVKETFVARLAFNALVPRVVLGAS